MSEMKKINFNLKIDGKQIRTLEDLRANFNIDDIYEYYNKGLLTNWCENREFLQQKDELKSIDKNAKRKDIILEIASIFDVGDIERIKDLYEQRELIELHKKNLIDFRKADEDRRKIISDYYEEYVQIKEMLFNEKEKEKVKKYLKEIETNYNLFFKLERFDVFSEAIMNAPLVALSMIADPYYREFFCFTDLNGESYNIGNQGYENEFRHIVLEKFMKHLREDNVDFEGRKTSKGGTGKTWVSLAKNDRKIIVLKIDSMCEFKPYGEMDKAICHGKDLKNFKIMNGLEFMTNTQGDSITYWEV